MIACVLLIYVKQMACLQLVVACPNDQGPDFILLDVGH